jgi:hypothetical protein
VIVEVSVPELQTQGDEKACRKTDVSSGGCIISSLKKSSPGTLSTTISVSWELHDPGKVRELGRPSGTSHALWTESAYRVIRN